MTRSVDFRALYEGTSLPSCEPTERLTKITFRTCPGSDLALTPVVDNNPFHIDSYGVPNDAWWTITTTTLPTRTVRLTKGSESLCSLLVRYGFQDGTGCLNHASAATAHYGPRGSLPPHTLSVPEHLRDAVGVPQFYRNSGVCWYAALCTSTFSNKFISTLVLRHLPPDIACHARSCLQSRDEAEKLRKALWYRFHVGDNVEDPPERDGRNGCGEFCVLCAKLKIPMYRYRESGGRLKPMDPRVSDRRGQQCTIPKPASSQQDHLLVLRYQDGDHAGKFPVLRRIWHGVGDKNHQRYRLVGVYMGQLHCGHQIGLACSSRDCRNWVIGDADMHSKGIGMTHVEFDDVWKDNWWKAWRDLVHVTKFGPGNQKTCVISPHNPRNDLLDNASSKNRPGTNSIDLIYVPASMGD